MVRQKCEYEKVRMMQEEINLEKLKREASPMGEPWRIEIVRKTAEES